MTCRSHGDRPKGGGGGDPIKLRSRRSSVARSSCGVMADSYHALSSRSGAAARRVSLVIKWTARPRRGGAMRSKTRRHAHMSPSQARLTTRAATCSPYLPIKV
jgi:hypothetical protein